MLTAPQGTIRDQEQLTTSQCEAVAYIEAYDFALIREKLIREGAVSVLVVDEAIDEFRKFLMLAAVGYKGLAMSSPEVDEVWHTFILFTRDYAEFCQNAFGHFLHHQPATSVTPVSAASRDSFRDGYTSLFGEIPAIWRGAAHGMADDDEKCEATTNCQSKDCYVGDPPR